MTGVQILNVSGKMFLTNYMGRGTVNGVDFQILNGMNGSMICYFPLGRSGDGEPEHFMITTKSFVQTCVSFTDEEAHALPKEPD